MHTNLPKAIMLAGSSGAGKTTIAQYLLSYNDQFSFSVSACTRPPRPQEVHGQSYYFLSIEDFQQKIQEQAFIEWKEVYEDSYYGTLKAEVERINAANKIAIFDIDVQGGLKLKSFFKENAIAVYIQPPSTEVLLARLRSRNTEQETEISCRMRKVEEERKAAHLFDDILINGSLEESKRKARQLANQLLQR